MGAPLDHLKHLFGQVRDFLPTLDAAHTAMLGYALASMPKNPVRLDAAFHFRFARHVSDNLASWDCSPNDLAGGGCAFEIDLTPIGLKGAQVSNT